MIDENGLAKPVYHGTIAKFTLFRPEPSRRSGGIMGAGQDVHSPASFFSESPYLARAYGDDKAEAKDMAAKTQLYRVFVSIKNPFDMTRDRRAVIRDLENMGIESGDPQDAEYPPPSWPGKLTMWMLLDRPDVIEKLKASGYDGAKLSETHAARDFALAGDPYGTTAWATFDPRQVRLAKKS